MAIPYVVTVDTEEEWDWDGPWPIEGLQLANIQTLPRFQDVCSQYGVAATYFVDHAVLNDPAAREVVLALGDRPRVELGMHIHPWNTPPLASAGPVQARDTFLHNLPPERIREKLLTVWESFRTCNLRPTSFRGGRYSSGPHVQEFLREHRFVADASVCPYSTWTDDGAPDYRRRGAEPRRLPPRREGELPLWELPLTLGFTRRPERLWQRWYDVVEHSPLRRLRLIGVGERLNVVRKVWLNFESPLGEHMIPYVQRLQRRGAPFLCFTLHSSSLMPGGNTFTRTQADADRLFAQLNATFAWLSRSPDFRPVTVSQLAQELEERHHAHSWN